jgi:hypothetical protein
MPSELENWMLTNDVSPGRFLEIMKRIDPGSHGVSRRTLYNAKQSGTMDTRTLVLMVAASRVLVAIHEVRSELTLQSFDQWCFLDYVSRVVYQEETEQE